MKSNQSKEVYDKYWWINNHPKFNSGCWIEITPHMVNPDSLEVSDFEEENTLLRLWVECGGYDEEGSFHDWRLDCGGNTWEEAVSSLYELVLKEYGEY